MKRNFNLCLLAGAIAVTSLTACSDDQMDPAGAGRAPGGASLSDAGGCERAGV